MFEALRSAIAKKETAGAVAAPLAAIRIATKVRADVRAGQKANTARAKARRVAAAVKSGAKRVKRGKKRKGSGISIDAVGAGNRITLTASNEVQAKAAANGERDAYFEIVSAEVRSAAGVK